MSKAILEFNLPEDRESFELAYYGDSYSFVLSDFDQWLRNMAKYEDKETITIEEARKHLRQLMDEREIPR